MWATWWVWVVAGFALGVVEVLVPPNLAGLSLWVLVVDNTNQVFSLLPNEKQPEHAIQAIGTTTQARAGMPLRIAGPTGRACGLRRELGLAIGGCRSSIWAVARSRC